MDAREPTLTRLDQRVLEHVPGSFERGVRARGIADQLNGTTYEEVRGILRGMEHLGYVTGRCGWWRRLARSDANQLGL